jgi:hypothetical protein
LLKDIPGQLVCIDDHISDFSPRSFLDFHSLLRRYQPGPSFCTAAVMPLYDLYWFDMPCSLRPPCLGRYQPLYPDQDHPWTNALVTKDVVHPTNSTMSLKLCGWHALARSYAGSQPMIWADTCFTLIPVRPHLVLITPANCISLR